MQFPRWKLPVAYSMVEVAKLTLQELPQYICYWSAFNSIYATVMEYSVIQNSHSNSRRKPRFKEIKNGVPGVKMIGKVKMPIVETYKEREQIDNIFKYFSKSLKHDLIVHPSTSFFVNRVPRWDNKDIAHDAFHQSVNGVIKVGYMVDIEYPVWSHISTESYEKYINGIQADRERDLLSKQILEVLYTVRNNIVHGGKRADDSNDVKVTQQALPLLSMIVLNFFSDQV